MCVYVAIIIYYKNIIILACELELPVAPHPPQPRLRAAKRLPGYCYYNHYHYHYCCVNFHYYCDDYHCYHHYQYYY